MTTDDAAPPRLPGVQRAVLALSAIGESTEEIAADLQLAVPEVRGHLAAAVGTLGARSGLEAILAARRLRLIVLPSALQRAVLRALAGGATLVGTPRTLARSLRVSVGELRDGLRGLLEVQLIAVSSGARGQLVVRLERRVAQALPPLPPAIERRRPGPDSVVF
jgi:DNA-binding CsgD family transcriptional regulator